MAHDEDIKRSFMQRRSLRGSPLEPSLKKGPGIQECVLLNVYTDTYTCDVWTESGGFVPAIPWPRMYSDPNGMSGEVSVPKRGHIYYVDTGGTQPVLLTAVPQEHSAVPPLVEHRVQHSSAPVATSDASRGTRNFRGGMPADVSPGDWLRLGNKGNLVGVLEDGVTLLKASELAQVIASATGDILRLVGRNTELITDFGTVQFSNDGGKVSLTLRGGSQQTTETDASEEHFTIRADLGHAGELVDFRVTDPQGATLARLHWAPDGRVTRHSTGVFERAEGNFELQADGSAKVSVGKEHTMSVRLDSRETVGAGKYITTGGDVEFAAGNDAALIGTRNVSLVAGRYLDVTVAGNPAAQPGEAAYKTVVTNGSYVLDVGSPTAGDAQTVLSGIKLSAYNNFVIESTAGVISLRTNKPDSVILGGSSPAYTGMLFEAFEAFITAFGDAVDNHIHPTGLGPSGPPAVPPFRLTKSQVRAIRSSFVKLGG